MRSEIFEVWDSGTSSGEVASDSLAIRKHADRGSGRMHTCRCRSDVEPERRRCPACGDEYRAHGSEDSEQLEIEVRAYRRVIKRRRYRRSCQCAAAPALLVTAAPPPRLIPKGFSVWVTVLIDICCTGPRTGCWRICARMGWIRHRLASSGPCAPLREALIARSRTGQHWHADGPLEAKWVFSAHAGPDPFGAGADSISDHRRSSTAGGAAVVLACGATSSRCQRAGRSRGVGRQWLADIATLYHLNDERLQVR